jgi:hypothetical protein
MIRRDDHPRVETPSSWTALALEGQAALGKLDHFQSFYVVGYAKSFGAML